MKILEDKKDVIIAIELVGILILTLTTLVLTIIKYNGEEESSTENISYADDLSLETTVTDETDETDEIGEVKVDIKGEVKNPGVYRLPSNSIVQDVIDAAGGLTKSATTKNINLSATITDEMVIYVYSKKELTTNTSSIISDTSCTTNVISITDTNSTTTTTTALININTASKEELMTLPSIGSSKADSIIIYRTETKFNSIEDIMNVSGIGDSLYAKIKDYITV